MIPEETPSTCRVWLQICESLRFLQFLGPNAELPQCQRLGARLLPVGPTSPSEAWLGPVEKSVDRDALPEILPKIGLVHMTSGCVRSFCGHRLVTSD